MPSPVVSRVNTIAYAGTTIGGTTDYQLVGPFQIEEDYESFKITTQVLCQDDTRSSFVTECNALETAYRTINGDLTVTLNGTAYKSFTHAGDTGMLARPTIRKVGSPADTNNSRLYEVSVSVMLPADESGKNGRRSSSITVASDGSNIQTLFIQAEYTAIGGTTALAQARANFATYAGTVETVVDNTVTWDDATVRYSYDDENKVCTATYMTRELIFNQTAAGLDSSSLKGAQIQVTTTREPRGVDAGSGAKPLLRVRVAFSSAVPKGATTDLRSLYENTVRPHLVSTAEDQSGVGSLTLVRETPNPDPVNNVLSAVLEFIASDGTQVLDSQTEIQLVERPPELLVPVLDGDPFSVDVHYQPPLRFAVITGSGWEVGAGEKALSVYRAQVRKFKGLGYREVQEENLRDQLIEFPGSTITPALLTRSRLMRWSGQYVRTRGSRPAAGGRQVDRTRTRTR